MIKLKDIKDHSTPFYYYDLELLSRTVAEVIKSSETYNYKVHYALKANVQPEILKVISDAGIGADCVSGNEILTAIQNGFSKSEVVYAGVGKTDDEIKIALENDIFCFNCESFQEIEVINEIANSLGKFASIAIRINPNVLAHTHHYITTGLEENKFGINLWEIDQVLELIQKSKNINLIGLHFHIGSQITDFNVFKTLAMKMNEIIEIFENKNIRVEHINAGGGVGVNYLKPDEESIPDFVGYFKIFHQFLNLRNYQQLHFELGRSIVAQCGSLISKALYIKNGVTKNFLIIDAGMTELLRPALYQAYHKVENISGNERSSTENVKYDVVGPICESSDCFGKEIELPETKRNDIIAIRTAGAYGEVMSFNYNLRAKHAPVFHTVKDLIES